MYSVFQNAKKKDCGGINVRFINKDSDNKILYVFYRSALKKLEQSVAPECQWKVKRKDISKSSKSFPVVHPSWDFSLGSFWFH